jgi:hypothetical protein
MRYLLLAIPVALLSACAATPQKEGPRAAKTDACVSQSSITGFKALDESRVILYDDIGSKKAYLAEVMGGCFDLSHQSRLSAIDGDGNRQICGYGRDSIAYEQFGRVENCRIMTVELLTDESLAAALEKKARKPRKVIIE